MTPAPAPSLQPTRRRFLRRTLQVGAGLASLGGGTIGYGLWEASQIRVLSTSVTVPLLPEPFEGKTIALLADFHHGPYVSLDFLRQAIELTHSHSPDMIALVGDFAHRGIQAHKQLPPCLNTLSALEAPLGVFAVPGNHDMLNRGTVYREVIAQTPLTDLTNRSIRLTLAGEHLWIAGVDDMWFGRPNLSRALEGIPANSAILLLCHNPDFAETHPDPRVGLMLSGHTHGGQVYLPLVGSPWIPSNYGEKYLCGLVEGPASQVFVTRGLGETAIPIRLNSPPEINLLSLRRTVGR